MYQRHWPYWMTAVESIRCQICTSKSKYVHPLQSVLPKQNLKWSRHTWVTNTLNVLLLIFNITKLSPLTHSNSRTNEQPGNHPFQVSKHKKKQSVSSTIKIRLFRYHHGSWSTRMQCKWSEQCVGIWIHIPNLDHLGVRSLQKRHWWSMIDDDWS